MLISNHPGQTRSAGGALAGAGAGLASAAAMSDLGGGAGGDATPRTDAALGSLSRDWRSGLSASGQQVTALGGFADLMAAAVVALDGGRHLVG